MFVTQQKLSLKKCICEMSLTLAVVAMTAEYLVLNKTKRKYQMSQLNGL